jgi:hypothetical protein
MYAFPYARRRGYTSECSRSLRNLVRTMPAVIGYGAGLALTLGVFDYTGNSVRGLFHKGDEVARKEAIRANRRRPLEETIATVGEGRGMF